LRAKVHSRIVARFSATGLKTRKSPATTVVSRSSGGALPKGNISIGHMGGKIRSAITAGNLQWT